MYEGVSGYFVLVVEETTEGVSCSVRHVSRPDTAVATGQFADEHWAFEGESQLWANVPEYLLIPAGGARRHLLRIADGATPDALEHLGVVTAVSGVPNSRLVVLAGEGHITAWDPVGRRAGVHLRLTGGTDNPTMRFRSEGAELWVNDGSTLLKFETKTWDVIDAAGSEPEGGSIVHWDFDSTQSHCAVVRENQTGVILIDVETMLPVGHAQFDAHTVDSLAVDGRIIALDQNGRFSRRLVLPISQEKPFRHL